MTRKAVLAWKNILILSRMKARSRSWQFGRVRVLLKYSTVGPCLILNIYFKGFSFGETAPEQDLGPYIQAAIDQVY